MDRINRIFRINRIYPQELNSTECSGAVILLMLF
jgi:hypothetical protein